MKQFGDMPIRDKLVAVNVLISSVVLLLSSTAYFIHDTVSYRNTLTSELTGLANVVAFNCRAALTFDDPSVAKGVLSSLSGKQDFVAARVFDADGKAFAEYGKTDRDSSDEQTAPRSLKPGHYYDRWDVCIVVPVVFEGDTIGTVHIRHSLHGCRTRLIQYGIIVLAILGIATLMAWLLSQNLQKLVTRPLADLAQTALRVSRERDYAIRAERSSNDEIGILVSSFNDMLSQIQKRDEGLIFSARELREYQDELRSLASQLMLTEEKERRRIAEEVHDTICQILVISKLKLELLVKKAPEEHRRELQQIAEFLGESIDRIRTLTFELSPPVLYELGLTAALNDLAERTAKKHGVAVSFEGRDLAVALPEDVGFLVYRAVQELLVNAVKHAEPDHITVALRKNANHLEIAVADDGVGCDMNKFGAAKHTSDGGFGLFSIRERLRHINGHMTMNSSPGKGTEVRMTVRTQAGTG